jgi:hypothetical protein
MPSSEVMHKFKKGTLKSGSGEPVKDRDQALAILMSEKRNEEAHGGHYESGAERKRPKRKRS